MCFFKSWVFHGEHSCLFPFNSHACVCVCTCSHTHSDTHTHKHTHACTHTLLLERKTIHICIRTMWVYINIRPLVLVKSFNSTLCTMVVLTELQPSILFLWPWLYFKMTVMSISWNWKAASGIRLSSSKVKSRSVFDFGGYSKVMTGLFSDPANDGSWPFSAECCLSITSDFRLANDFWESLLSPCLPDQLGVHRKWYHMKRVCVCVRLCVLVCVSVCVCVRESEREREMKWGILTPFTGTQGSYEMGPHK